MANPPFPLQVGTPPDDAYQIINENFRNAALDIRDFGAASATSVSLSFTIGAGLLGAQTAILLSSEKTSVQPNIIRTQSPVDNIAVSTPFITLLIDGATWPTGTAKDNMEVQVIPIDPSPFSALAAFTVQIQNLDSASHTYQVTLSASYIPSGSTSQFA